MTLTPEQCEAFAAAAQTLADLFRAAAIAPRSEYLTVAEASAEFGVSISHLNDVLARRELAYVQTGKRKGWKIARADMERWMKERTVPARGLREAKRTA